MAVTERFWDKTQLQPDGCLVWTAYRNAGGYGIFRADGRPRPAHRWIYEQIRGPVGELTIDHLCRNRACVNVEHLEAITFAENIRRGRNIHREKTHCPKGHSYADAYVLWSKGVWSRRCRICHRDYVRGWDKARRGK